VGEDSAKEIQALTLRVPREVHEALRTLSFATDTSVNELILRAVRDYLSEEGHRAAVDGFLAQARDRYKVALDKLADL
jgi:predicted transcriptional regulator